MKYKHTKGDEIQGELDLFVSHSQEGNHYQSVTGNEILIHGNPEGLRSLAKLLLEIAELNQEAVEDKFLPVGAREHYHLRAGIELSKSSNEVIIGRLEAKGRGAFYDRFISKNQR